MKKVLLLTISLGMVAIAGYSQKDKTWSFSNANPAAVATAKAVKRQSFPTEFKLFELDAPALKQQLFSVVANAASHTTIISVPNANGELEQFEMVEASNFEPALQAQFPEIRAFSGKSLIDPGATIKLSYSPEGVQTMVFRTETENEFIEPYSADHQLYAVYRSERSKGKLPWTCSTEDKAISNEISGLREVKLRAAGASGGTLKTMRLAQSCNGEYANFFGATSASQVNLVLGAFNATLTRCNGVYEKDLALHLNLIPQTTSVIYYNPSTDPYTTLSNWNLQLQQTLTSVIGSANYDIGHMFGASGGGGNAGCIGCVCVDPANSNSKAKGSGITSPADGIPQGDNFDIDYVAHEVGHQLGANHTFSHSLEGTGQNKEVGSGITIMGYAGITSYDVARHSIDIFHETSIAQIQANLANKICPVTTNITANNTAPTIGAVSNYTIPISTPFALTATASDAQGDALTYCWEQNDNATTSGSGSVASPTKTTGPNFISFSPTPSPTRLFPKLATILTGSNVSGPLPGGDAVANTEALSSVSRTLNFRLTVRDNHIFSSTAPVSVGQTAFTDVIVTVTNTSGPFAVTAPNTNVTWTGGSTATVTWSVNGTNAGSVNCANVKILLSTDGGNTFPTTLAASVPNNGTASVTVPNTPGTTNRVKVEAIGNIFFDISNSNFTIVNGGPSCNAPAGLSSSAITQTSATVSWGAVSGAQSYAVDYKEASSSTWINAVTATTSTSVGLNGLTAGTTYDWRVRTNCSSSSSTYSQAQFTTSPVVVNCDAPTGLASSVTENSATVSWSNVGAISYDVNYKASSSGTWLNAATGTTSTSVNISGLSASTNYDWQVKSNCASGSSSYVQAAFTTDPSTAPPCPGADDISTNGSASGAATILVNTDVYGLIESRGDNDYYKFVATSNSATITLTNLPADYHLELRNAAGNVVIGSSANTGTVDEVITASGLVTGTTYAVRVYPKNNGQWNANSCYKLTVSAGTGRMSAPEMIVINKGMIVSPNPVKSNVKVNFVTEENGNASISLLDQTGAVIATQVVAINAGVNNKNLFVGNVANGMYYIKLQTKSGIQMSKILVSK